jgi:hypothetical protein
MNYFGASINTSSVVAEVAGVAIENGAFCAVKYDENGAVVLCSTEGEMVVGILLPETTQKLSAGEDVTVQIKDIGYCKAGAEIKKGQEVMVDAKGRVIPATAGKFVIGYAMTSATAEDEIIEVDIRKCGYKA